MIRRHAMPFGATCDADGTLFRLWAPDISEILIQIDAGRDEVTRTMNRDDGGWHEIRADGAGPGTLYRFRLPDGLVVPDPASRYQPADVHGPSEVIDPAAFDWRDGDWRGRPWDEAVVYELHVGAFTPEGTFLAVIPHLASLAELGITVIELMPVSDFPGLRNWGYDGAYPFAPDATYGRPEDLKSVVQAAHDAGLMVLLDVVYNHFGPEGNYLGAYASPFFTERHHTPWGAAINFGGRGSRTVRDFFIENALYWLEEFHIDGLRLDAVHAIHDESHPHILTELAQSVRSRLPHSRPVHLVLENDANEARRLRGADSAGALYDAQWNDDFHHTVHHMITGEGDGYYADYAAESSLKLGRTLTEGFVYQGEASAFRNGAPRGEPSTGLPVTAFVNFIQNHDQVGNRAMGERIDRVAPDAAVVAATALYLLAPSPPLIFMGEEWRATEPFPFFCDFGRDLADAVRDGRRNEFARFPAFRDATAREAIPDPNSEQTFRSAVLDPGAERSGAAAQRRALFAQLLALRKTYIVPLLRADPVPQRTARNLGPETLLVCWQFARRSTLSCMVNLSARAATIEATPPAGKMIYSSHQDVVKSETITAVPAWFVAWFAESA